MLKFGSEVNHARRWFRFPLGPMDLSFQPSELAKLADVILVVGAANSSNSNRLREIGIEEGLPSYLINDGSELKPEWVKGKKVVGLTAGASAPEELVRHVIEALERIEPVTVETMDGKKEHIEFRLPAELRA